MTNYLVYGLLQLIWLSLGCYVGDGAVVDPLG